MHTGFSLINNLKTESQSLSSETGALSRMGASLLRMLPMAPVYGSTLVALEPEMVLATDGRDLSSLGILHNAIRRCGASM